MHDFGHRILGNFRGNYQYVPQDVIPYADQMSVGGFGSVRGYSQGLLTAKWSAGVGLRFQLPYNIVLKAAYGFQLHDNDYETRDKGDWSLEFSFSPDFNKFFE